MVVFIHIRTNYLFYFLKMISDAADGELSDWAAAKVQDRMYKSLNWNVYGIETFKLYMVTNPIRQHTVNLEYFSCTCCKWQLSGLPCGHAIAVARFLGYSDCNHLAFDWFKKTKLQGTYQELVYPIGDMSSWELPNGLQVVKPPAMVVRQSGRPKNKNRVRSQGEEPNPVRCSRCQSIGHRRTACREPFPKKKKANINNVSD